MGWTDGGEVNVGEEDAGLSQFRSHCGEVLGVMLTAEATHAVGKYGGRASPTN